MNFNFDSQYIQQYSRNMQPMTVSQSIQAIQGHQASQISSSVNLPQQYLFFYKPHNDFQIYHITCKEISFEMISRLLINNDSLAHNNVQSNNSHLFCYQHPDDKKIYKVICEIVSYDHIICMLNKIHYGNELNLNEQQQVEFSQELKDNLELHLKHDLINYLTPFNM